LLIVDDEPNILNALRRLLRREYYEVLTANSPREAFDLLAQHSVQVVVSDQRMPDMTGTEFLARVKQIYPATVRIVLSGYTDLETLTDAINRGAIYRFLVKPWNDEELRSQLREAFRVAHGIAHA
jgi:response regulator RpfG family c-di-GMP phosphodiesterase